MPDPFDPLDDADDDFEPVTTTPDGAQGQSD